MAKKITYAQKMRAERDALRKLLDVADAGVYEEVRLASERRDEALRELAEVRASNEFMAEEMKRYASKNHKLKALVNFLEEQL